MTLSEGKEELKEILLASPPVLFLGAGFSVGAKNALDTMAADDLKDHIFQELIVGKVDAEYYDEIRGYDLRHLCDEVNSIYKSRDVLDKLLTSCYKGTKPDRKNPFHLKLASYPWNKIFTVNIDDLVENVYKSSDRELVVQNQKKLKLTNSKETILFKLHGCVNRPEEGYIFSGEDYLELITKKVDAKLNDFTSEILQNNVIFIGASLDEPDIEYYLKMYLDAGCKLRSNRLVFIDIQPSRNLQRKAKELDALLIKASTEEFLEFLSSINFKPDELEKSVIDLRLNGIFRLAEMEKLYKEPYESHLYSGNFCVWQDVADKWVFPRPVYHNAWNKLTELLTVPQEVCCFSIYGKVYAGKSCLAKMLAYDLALKGFDVLEYRFRKADLNLKAVFDYIKSSPHNRFVLLIDGGSYYYERIEKFFNHSINGKKLVIITTSREYYHKKKRYYLEGNNYIDFEAEDIIKIDDARAIYSTLGKKSFLSYMASMDEPQALSSIMKQKNMVNLIVSLTYGNISTKIVSSYEKMFSGFTDDEKKLLTELAIFDVADIETYPKELFTERFGSKVNLDGEINIDDMKVVDLVRTDGVGLLLRNSILNSFIIEKQKGMLKTTLIGILKYVSRFVSERNNNTWYIIFQSLMKEDVLEKKFHLKPAIIKEIFLSVKGEYKEISYYWLQLGLLSQKMGDYVTAFNYLSISSSIRPRSYKIQHAIARNYMRHANRTKDAAEAKALFEKGEEKMRELIESKDYGKEKAKPYSVNSYVREKINFINRFKLDVRDSELKYMRDILDSIPDYRDPYMESVVKLFYVFLEQRGKTGILKMDLNSPYMKYIGRKNIVNKEMDDIDPVIDAI